jgi:UDP-glucose 4-epimerase
MKRTILITGVAGNIGSGLAESLCENSDNLIIGVDNLLTGDMKKVPLYKENFKFIKIDVNNYNDISSLFSRYEIDFVFHFAAVVGVLRTLENPLMVLKDIDGIKNVLDLSKNTGVKKVFYSSSSEVYGEPVSLPQHEKTTPLNSRLPYAIVKNLGEAFFRSYYQEHGLKYTIFRFFNTYGPHQSKDFVISKFVDRAMKNQDINLYGDGLQTRTFCYINDNIDTMKLILNNDLLDNDIVNIGSSVETTILELAELIIERTNSNSKIKMVTALEEGDMTRRLPDNDKMINILNRELISLKDGLDLYLNSIK